MQGETGYVTGKIVHCRYEGRKFKNAEVDAYMDNLIKNDPLHTWLAKPADEFKRGIRSGELQEVYKDLFEGK